MTRLEILKAELVAIDFLDRFYWQAETPERHENLGYLVRQNRRRDIIAELLNLLCSGQRDQLPLPRKMHDLLKNAPAF
jgi:hypothetical protein